MSKNLKNKVDSIRRTFKNNSLEVLGIVIESKILELYPNHETQWNSDVRAEVIKAINKDHQTTETINAITSPTSETITHYQEVETLTQEEIQEEELDILTPVEESIESFEYEQDEVTAMSTTGYAYALAEKTDLVTAIAHNMGIELKLTEVESIASNLDYSADSLEEGIEDIESAVTAFVEYRMQVNQEKINRMVTQVRSTVTQRNEETSEQLNNGLKQIAKDIQQGNTDFKSSVRSALKCFAIPTEKTG